MNFSDSIMQRNTATMAQIFKNHYFTCKKIHGEDDPHYMNSCQKIKDCVCVHCKQTYEKGVFHKTRHSFNCPKRVVRCLYCKESMLAENLFDPTVLAKYRGTIDGSKYKVHQSHYERCPRLPSATTIPGANIYLTCGNCRESVSECYDRFGNILPTHDCYL